MNDIDRAYKEMLMKEAERRFTQMSKAVAEALIELGKELTMQYLCPEKLRERISLN